MSDKWILLIPEDPHFVPGVAAQRRACDRLRQIVPDAFEVVAKVSEKVEFFDCGVNFERIVCPACAAEVPIDWWRDRMEEEYDGGYSLASYAMPCCKAQRTLHELVYEWPQGFGRFALEAFNPGIGELSDRDKYELEAILGTELREIYRHI
jgi:hypothetical protein